MEESLPDQPIAKLQRCQAEPRFVDNSSGDEADEKGGAIRPIPAHLANVLPVETPHQFNGVLDANRPTYGRWFANEDEYVAFMMLPIPESKRPDLLLAMSEDVRARKAALLRTEDKPKASRARDA